MGKVLAVEIGSSSLIEVVLVSKLLASSIRAINVW